ncbi:MAG: hypothetical protein WD042_06840 [Phycisphaeraceae bacterium]
MTGRKALAYMVASLMIVTGSALWALAQPAEQARPQRPQRAQQAENGERPERPERPQRGPRAEEGDRAERPGPGKPGEPRERIAPMIGQGLHEIVRGLELEPADREKVKAAFDKFHEDRQAFMETHKDELEKAHQEVRAAREAQDREKVRAAMDKAHEILKESPKPEDLIKALRAALPAEKQAEFDKQVEALREKVKERGQEMQQRRPGGPGSPGGPDAAGAPEKDGDKPEGDRPQRRQERPRRGGEEGQQKQPKPEAPLDI